MLQTFPDNLRAGAGFTSARLMSEIFVVARVRGEFELACEI